MQSNQNQVLTRIKCWTDDGQTYKVSFDSNRIGTVEYVSGRSEFVAWTMGHEVAGRFLFTGSNWERCINAAVQGLLVESNLGGSNS